MNMKKCILVIISFLLLIHVYFPKTFMGRIYIKDFEQRCFEPHYYDAVTYHVFKYGTIEEWKENSDIEWQKRELEGIVIRITTSYNIDCYFFEDGTTDGVIWCTVDGYAKGSVIVGRIYREHGPLSDVEERARREAIKTFNRQVDKVNRKMIDKMHLRCKYVVIILCVVWFFMLIGTIIAKKMTKLHDEQMEKDFEDDII